MVSFTNYFMKKYLLVVAIFAFCSLSSSAQEIRFNAYSSFMFADQFDSYWDAGNNYYYNGKLEEGLQWGGGFEYMVNDMLGIEVSYLRQDTNSPTRYRYVVGPDQFTNFDLGLNYIMVAPTRYFRAPGSPVEGFAGIMGGMLIASLNNPDNGHKNTVTKLAWGIKGGGIYWASDRMGVKLQAELMSAVQSVGGGFYFGTGGGGAGLSSYSSIYQFGLGGGLVFKLK